MLLKSNFMLWKNQLAAATLIPSLLISACDRGSIHKSPAPPQPKPQPPLVETPSEPKEERPPQLEVGEDETMKLRRQQVLDTLWTSQLGRLFSSFLFDVARPDEVTSMAREVCNRITKNNLSRTTYLSALHLLTQDLYERRLIDDERQRRLLLLQGMLNERQAEKRGQPTEGLFNYAMYALLAALPFGSPQVRNLMGYIVNRTGKVVDRFLPGVGMSRLFPNATVPKASDFALFEILRTFQPTYPFKQFFNYFGPITLMYFYWYDWNESRKGKPIDPELQERVHDQRKFFDFLRQLSTL